MPNQAIQLIAGEDDGTARLAGPLDLAHLVRARALLRGRKGLARLDVGGLTRLDTAGAMLLTQMVQQQVELVGLSPAHEQLYRQFAETEYDPPEDAPKPGAGRALVIHLGEGAVEAWDTCRALITFLGQSSIAVVRALSHPKRLRVGEVVHHIEQIGINAIPIIALIAFLISVVIAYQSAEQLRPLGAQQFTVNLITISVLREMGVLLTAIMVAGRTGSAFTAEIGVMKLREEVDALKAMGIDPFELLVVPRLLALVIALPVLTFIADIMGLVGGGVLSWLLIGISAEQYITRVHDVAANGHALFVGLVKAPVFAFFIGLVGCMHGMKVSGSAESVGTETTISVVQSIFLVLVIDALFSIFFQQVGI